MNWGEFVVDRVVDRADWYAAGGKVALSGLQHACRQHETQAANIDLGTYARGRQVTALANSTIRSPGWGDFH
jgi:hypothetical protein